MDSIENVVSPELEKANETINDLLKQVESLKAELARVAKNATTYRDALLCLAKEVN